MHNSNPKNNKVSPEEKKLAQIFVDDFLSLSPEDVISKWKRFGGTHPFPSIELIYEVADAISIDHFIASKLDLETKLRENFDGVLLVRDLSDGQNGYSLLYLEKGNFIKGRFFTVDNYAKYALLMDSVLATIEWDFSPK